MNNPLQNIGLFATPASPKALYSQIESLAPSEKRVAYLYSGMTMNLCHDLVEKSLNKEGQKMKLVLFRGAEYATPLDAELDGADYDTGLRLTSNEFEANREVYEALVKTTAQCINSDLSNMKLALVVCNEA